MYEVGIDPTEWKMAKIHPVPKKGDLTKVENYRPISLTEVFRKIFERMLLVHVLKFIEPLNMEQGGFRHQRSTIDQTMALEQAMRYMTHKEGVSVLPHSSILKLRMIAWTGSYSGGSYEVDL